MYTFRLCLAGIFLAASVTSQSSDGTVVTIGNGQVKGSIGTTLYQNLTFYSFRGIPFAEPPVGNLRFEPPVPKSNWAGVLDATQDGPSCVQDGEGSEDCLVANVYTTQKVEVGCTPRPILIWIYGGAFAGGSSTYSAQGPDAIIETGIIVVTFNYRVGIFGFLATGDLVVPGNNGLKDQLLLLKWVNQNIASFCGDPTQITIGGSSAGGGSVAYQLQSPLADGLYQRAILQSGTSLNPFMPSNRLLELGPKVGQALGVDVSTSQTLVNGLRQIPSDQLQNVTSSVISSSAGLNPLNVIRVGPIIEPTHAGAIVTQKSHERLQNGGFSKVNMIVGYNSKELGFDLPATLLAYFDISVTSLVPPELNVNTLGKLSAATKIKLHYFGIKPVALSSSQFQNYISDREFAIPIRQFVKLTRSATSVYYYRFSYEGGLGGNYNGDLPGVTHAEELGYIWNPFFEPTSNEDLIVRSRFILLWTSFIKYGTPTPSQTTLLQNIIWTPADSQYTYLDIGENLVLSQNPENNDMQFWDGIVSKYGKPPFDAYA